MYAREVFLNWFVRIEVSEMCAQESHVGFPGNLRAINVDFTSNPRGLDKQSTWT